MSEKVISVKSGKVIEKDEKKWIELVDQEDHTHRVFPSMLGNDGAWVHLDKEVGILKSYIEAGTIEGKAFKLIKEKKGMYYNIIGIEEVKDAFVKEAQKQVEDKTSEVKNRSVAISYAKDLAMVSKIEIAQICAYAEIFYRYMNGTLSITDESLIQLMIKAGGKVEKKQGAPQIEPDTKAEVSQEVPIDKGGEARIERDEIIARIKECAVELSWINPGQKTQGLKLGGYIMRKFNKKGIPDLTDEQLTTLESALKEMAELK